jgi:hypothetical protein
MFDIGTTSMQALVDRLRISQQELLAATERVIDGMP